MASSQKRKAESHEVAPKRRHRNLFENMTEAEKEEMRKRADDTMARIDAEMAKVDAEMAAEAALPAEERRQNTIKAQSSRTMAHLRGVSSCHVTVQLAPWSPRGSTCRFETCDDTHIPPHSYRIALKPGLTSWHSSPDFFHVECFESLVDVTSPEVVSRIMPEYATNIDAAFILDGGAEQAVLEWITEQSGQDNSKSIPESLPQLAPEASTETNGEPSVSAACAAEHIPTVQSSQNLDAIDDPDGTKKIKLTVATENNAGTRETGADQEIVDPRHGLSHALDAWKARKVDSSRPARCPLTQVTDGYVQ